MKTPPEASLGTPPPSNSSTRRRLVAAGLLILGLAAYLAYHESKDSPEVIGQEHSGPVPASDAGNANSRSGAPSGDVSSARSTGAEHSPGDAGSATRSGHREAVTGGRKPVVDPMASWSEVPAWPDGPRLFAEVETSRKRYVNLRPNDLGLMPRLDVDANEPLKISLTLPEGGAGDTIYVEIPNGGRFPGVDLMGQTLAVDGKGRVAFDFIADESRGHCTVHIRQNGHTRTLPLWVGEPEAFVREDPASPNEPTP